MTSRPVAEMGTAGAPRGQENTMTQQKHVTPRMIGDWTTHFDADGYWTGTPGAVFLALCRGGGSFRDGGMLVIGRARTIRGASRVARRYAETTRGADTR